MNIEAFNQSLDHWISELDKYSFSQLCTKPAPGGWSIGQVYMHLIENTEFFLEQSMICASSDENCSEGAAPHGREMLSKNEFPDELIEGPPSNLDTPQPPGKVALYNGLYALKVQSEKVSQMLRTSAFKGKTKHPGLNYLNAQEWVQFADMHLRHHLRQKQRIDNFLKTVSVNSTREIDI